jgi:imidazolonepropionase-like amidohydrolase/Tol biopolymer transport system component
MIYPTQLLCLAFLILLAKPVFATDIKNTDEEIWDSNNPSFSVEAIDAEIDVTEGTWMSLDVSPDGLHIAFDLLGDIYQIPFQGGSAKALRSGHAWEIQPRYSPDGQSLAFTSDAGGADNIWVVEVDSGIARQISHEQFRLLNNPSWHPNGQYVVARKHYTTSRSLGTGEIWLYHTSGNEGNKGVPIVERPDKSFQKELGEPMFSPSGDVIYYTQNTTAGNTFIYHQDSNKELFQIKKVILASGKKTKVVGGPGGATRPTPSPDGQYIAYVKRVRAVSRLFMMNLDTNEEIMLVDSLDQDMQETWAVQGVYPNMDWTPDSQQIVYWAGGKIWRIDIASKEKINIPFRVSDSRSIYPAPIFPVKVSPEEFDTKMVRFAQPSPDGKSVLFESLGQISVKREGKAPFIITKENADGFDYSPIWSPNGDQIYFIRWTDKGLSSIRSVSSSGGRSKQLQDKKGQYSELSISSDGKTLAYRKLVGHSLRNPSWDNNPGIYLFDIRKQEASFVSDKGVTPILGQDGRVYLKYRLNKSGRESDAAQTTLISMTKSGLDIKELATSEFATEIKISPDNQWLAFVENRSVYVSALPLTGKTIEVGPKKTGIPTQRVSEIGGQYLNWSNDSRNLSWSVGPELKTVSVSAALFSKDNDQARKLQVTNLSQKVKTDIPLSKIAITGARIVTMDANRQVIENGTIIISGNRIEAIGSESKIKIPADAKIFEAKGSTIIPGLIDIHAHGAYGEGQIIPQKNWNSLAHLALGVTTVHNPSSRADQAFAAAEYARAGKILSPRIFSTGEIVYGAKSTSWTDIDSLDDALMHIRRLKAQGAISIKNYNQPRRNQRQQVIEAARMEGIMNVSEGGSLYHFDMNLIADGTTGVEHNVPTLIMYDDVTQFWRQSQAAYTPTLVVTYGGLTAEDYYYQETEVWKHPILSNFVPPSVLQARSVRRPMAPEEDYRDDDSAASAKVLLEAGVLVSTGGHGQREGLATHWELWSFVRGGMSPMQALSAATINPATYMGMQADLGSLEIGKLADLVILDSNPLDDISQTDKVSHIMLNGRVYIANSLKEIITGDKELDPFWWQTTAQGQIR